MATGTCKDARGLYPLERCKPCQEDDWPQGGHSQAAGTSLGEDLAGRSPCGQWWGNVGRSSGS